MRRTIEIIIYSIYICLNLQLSIAIADDKTDCKSKVLPDEQVLQACRRYIRSIIKTPIGETSIIGTFSGCEYEKIYPLMNGFDLICKSYGYHYAYGPKVQVIDYSTAIIDGDKYSVSFR